MNIIEPSVEILEQGSGIVGMYKHIELCARNCYKSEGSITETSHEVMLKKLIERKHTAMLEHGTVYLTIPALGNYSLYQKYFTNKYSVAVSGIDAYYITTNYRVVIENGWEADMQYFTDKQVDFHVPRICAKFNCDIGVSREYNRHRDDSIAESSTRYCNYTKEQHGNEITYVRPIWVDEEQLVAPLATFELEGRSPRGLSPMQLMAGDIVNGFNVDWTAVDYWLFALISAEFAYMGCIKQGWQTQQARDCLNLSTRTELIHTATLPQWKHFLGLRTPNSAHPSAQQLALQLQELLRNGGCIC